MIIFGWIVLALCIFGIISSITSNKITGIDRLGLVIRNFAIGLYIFLTLIL